MSFAEILLRLGCLLVGWILLGVHGLVLSVIPSLECASSGDGWLAALVLGVPAAGVPLLFRYGSGLRDMAATVRWLALPYAGLLVLAARPVFDAFSGTTLAGGPLCAAAPGEMLLGAGWLARAWAPLQLLLLAALAWAALRLFLTARADPA